MIAISQTAGASAPKRRLSTFGGWLTLIMGITVLIFGLPMFLMGIHLIALGGSWYYAIAGALFTVAAVQILREQRNGYWIFLATFAATLIWAFWEVGPSPWGLLPRALTFLVIALVCWATWPWIDRRLQPAGADPKLVRDLDRHLGFLGTWRTAAISAVAIIIVGGTSALVFPGPRVELPDTVQTPANYAFHAAAMPADPVPPGEWQNYGRVPGGQRFSPLNQITPANVGKLERAWTFHTGAVQGPNDGLPRRFAFESTPLAVRGKLIMCTPHAEVIAVDATTGREVWRFNPKGDISFAAVHDLPRRLVSPDPRGPGARPTPAVLVSTKSGQTFVLDRRNGRPLVPVTERRVPQGAVAGDFTSPTQPYSGFPSLAPDNFTEKSMWGVFPVDQLECRIKFHRSRYEGAFTPPSTQGSILLPGSLGVFEWGSASVDPVHGIMYANTSWTPMLTRLIPQLKYRGKPTLDDVGGYGLGTPYGSTVLAFLSSLGAPCIQPPWGHMTAIDLAAHRVLWRHPLGSFLGMKVGLPNMGGGAVTAGGVIFQGATPDSTFRAIDARTGKVLWSDKLPANANATPVVYQGTDGRQYVAIAAGGHAGMGPTSDAVVAYALPARS